MREHPGVQGAALAGRYPYRGISILFHQINMSKSIFFQTLGPLSRHPLGDNEVLFGLWNRLTTDLTNQDEHLILKGQASLTVITNTGQAVEITRADWNALSFRIRYYKKISAVFTLPPDIDMADVAFVEYSLNGENVPPYSGRVPLNNAFRARR